MERTSPVEQWLRLRAPSAGGLGSIPGPEARPCIPKLMMLYTTTETQHSQVKNKYFKKILWKNSNVLANPILHFESYKQKERIHRFWGQSGEQWASLLLLFRVQGMEGWQMPSPWVDGRGEWDWEHSSSLCHNPLHSRTSSLECLTSITNSLRGKQKQPLNLSPLSKAELPL